MTVRVGVIGVGNIGLEHVRRLTQVVSGARVVALADVDLARAEKAAARLSGARVHPTGLDLIGSDDVQAVLVASWGPTHAQFVVAAIQAGKPVFCEKPLAPTTDECLLVLDAEVARGQRLVQVGFMRHYDGAYRTLKQTIGNAGLGTPLMVHCAHRNQEVPPHFTGGMPITDTAIHEIDIVRWLLDQEIVATRVLRPRTTSRAHTNLQDPLIIVLEMASGALVDVEVFVTLPYGYDIRCEVVCEFGTAALGDASRVVIRKDGQRSDHVPNDFQERFGGAYETELQEWVDGVRAGAMTGPSAWDGYAATAVAEACLAALASDNRVEVRMRERPAFYTAAELLAANGATQ